MSRILTFLPLLAFLGCIPPGVSFLAAAADGGGREHLIHLPGIAGERDLDRQFIRGLRDGGYPGTLEIYDWPGRDPGLGALLARARNEREADKVSARIQELLRDDPACKVRLVGHSGGAGIAAWALERLPAEMKVETVVLVAPALSQRYDLSKALAHVRGRMYALTSVNDVIVLGAGTRLFGTIDGVKEEASGLRGFRMPGGADERQYAKLVQMPYAREWMDLGNIGDHIGPMGRRFAAVVIAPLLQDRAPATKPARDAGADAAAGDERDRPDEPAAATNARQPAPAGGR